MKSANMRFIEEQRFPALAYGVLAAATIVPLALIPALAKQRPPVGLTLGLTPMLALTANLLYMRTEVDDEGVTVTFGYLFPLYRRHVRRADIASAEAVAYSPLGEFGGWGIRGWGENVALNARGDRGVRLTLRNGNRLLIGSQRSEELAAALADAGSPR